MKNIVKVFNDKMFQAMFIGIVGTVLFYMTIVLIRDVFGLYIEDSVGLSIYVSAIGSMSFGTENLLKYLKNKNSNK